MSTDYDDDLYDPSLTSNEAFLAVMSERYPRQEPEPAPAPQSAAQPIPQVSVPTTAERQLSELRTKIANFDKAIADQTPTQRLTDHTEAGEKAAKALGETVPLRAERQRLALEADRLTDSIEWGFVGATDETLASKAEDLALELEAANAAVGAVPGEGMRSEADQARLARAVRTRDALLRQDAALKRERVTRREFAAYEKARERSIDAQTDRAIQTERAQALNDRLAKAQTEPGWSPDLAGYIRTEWSREVVTPEQRAAKRAQVAKDYDATINKGILEAIMRTT